MAADTAPDSAARHAGLRSSGFANKFKQNQAGSREAVYDLFFVIDSPFDRLRANGFEDFAVRKPRSC
ncbi:MAG: hypothetical protein IPL70_03175 [Uliginosibacterium sp.]|nr:hypothetical protein [Uliginosibacterium sp.]